MPHSFPPGGRTTCPSLVFGWFPGSPFSNVNSRHLVASRKIWERTGGMAGRVVGCGLGKVREPSAPGPPVRDVRPGVAQAGEGAGPGPGLPRSLAPGLEAGSPPGLLSPGQGALWRRPPPRPPPACSWTPTLSPIHSAFKGPLSERGGCANLQPSPGLAKHAGPCSRRLPAGGRPLAPCPPTPGHFGGPGCSERGREAPHGGWRPPSLGCGSPSHQPLQKTAVNFPFFPVLLPN